MCIIRLCAQWYSLHRTIWTNDIHVNDQQIYWHSSTFTCHMWCIFFHLMLPHIIYCASKCSIIACTKEYASSEFKCGYIKYLQSFVIWSSIIVEWITNKCKIYTCYICILKYNSILLLHYDGKITAKHADYNAYQC